MDICITEKLPRWLRDKESTCQQGSVVLARDYSILVVGVHSVVVRALIISSGGVKAPLSLWCKVHLY